MEFAYFDKEKYPRSEDKEQNKEDYIATDKREERWHC